MLLHLCRRLQLIIIYWTLWLRVRAWVRGPTLRVVKILAIGVSNGLWPSSLRQWASRLMLLTLLCCPILIVTVVFELLWYSRLIGLTVAGNLWCISA